MNTRSLSIFFWLLPFATSQLGAQELDQGSTPTFRSSTYTVEVTLVASHSNGSSVADLTADDLQVFDRCQKQKILSFERVMPPAAGAPPSLRTTRFSVLLLDALNTSFSDQVSSRMAAMKVIEQVRPGEMVAIFSLTLRGLRLLHNFSSDAQSLRRLVESFRSSGPGTENTNGTTGGAQNSAEFSYQDLIAPPAGPAQLFRQRVDLSNTLRAMTAVARVLKRLSGRKSLLWISAGFPLTIQSDPASHNLGGGAAEAQSFRDEVAATMRELSAANVAIYPIDARGLSADPRAYVNINGMKEMADKTGGKAFYNSNDIASQVRAALDDSKNAYVLTYNPDNYRADKSLHTIKIKTARRGIHLRYRRGYLAD